MTAEYPRISLRAARVNAKLGQKEAAKKLGISLSTLQNYESGKTSPDVHFLETLEKVYSFPAHNIFFGTTDT
ncbi:helix-turn-helix transcriptional regulator [Ruminococcaceae bacterium OttesenSCG-928-A16]|nr:helix-turn-helix transcriptional regulator [Ruminococcaceae bacterium OttesenSCG-928-A16]